MSNDTYTVFGRIGGEFLPSELVRIGPFSVGPLPPGISPHERPKWNGMAFDTAAQFTAQGGDIEVKSNCYFSIDCDAPSSGDAAERVKETEAALLQLAFTFHQHGTPCRTEVLWAQDKATRVSAYSRRSCGAGWRPVALSPEVLATIRTRFSVLSSNEFAKRAGLLYGRGIRQLDTATDTSDSEGALLSFFKVVECIAQAFDVTITPDIEDKQAYVLKSLTCLLNSEKSLKKRVAEVFDAQRHLARIELRYMALRIESAAIELGMPEAWRNTAAEFAKFRSQRLGHAGVPLSQAEIDHWLGKDKLALSLAQSMLLSYVDSLTSTRKPSG